MRTYHWWYTREADSWTNIWILGRIARKVEFVEVGGHDCCAGKQDTRDDGRCAQHGGDDNGL